MLRYGNMHHVCRSMSALCIVDLALVMNFSSKTIREYSVFRAANAFTDGRSPIESRLPRIYGLLFICAQRKAKGRREIVFHAKYICRFFVICFHRIQRTFDIVFYILSLLPQLLPCVASVDSTHTCTNFSRRRREVNVAFSVFFVVVVVHSRYA